MSKFFKVLALNVALATSFSLSAEVFENEVEYTLPSNNQKWKVGYELKNDKVKMVALIPENEEKQSATESFAISVVKGHPEQPLKPEEGIKSFLKSLSEREGVQIESKVVSSSDNEAVVEWWTKDEKSHNWVRGVTTPTGLITIMFTTRATVEDEQERKTQMAEKVEAAKKNWLPVISGAKVLQPAKS